MLVVAADGIMLVVVKADPVVEETADTLLQEHLVITQQIMDLVAAEDKIVPLEVLVEMVLMEL
tara:strand:- start:284 stop:472 length:189 start_codon:yes stop_codon:yes gene_type:complete